jgi:hypothetical protein
VKLSLIATSLLLCALLAACARATVLPAEPAIQTTFPVDRAREDGDWTVLERSMPWGEVTFLIPSAWTPEGLSDFDQLAAAVERDRDTAIVTLWRVKP